MATPSITMIPSGYKSQKVYSVLPTNGDGDFTFDRNNAGSRVNKNGLIEQVATDVPRLDYSDGSCPSLLLEPASTNLVIGSAEGNYLHLLGGLTNTISPDGTNNAIIPTPPYAYARYQETIPAGTYLNGQKLTYSWYRKRISTPTGVSVNGDLYVRDITNLTSLESNNATQIESNINGFDRFQVVVEIINGSLESEFRAYIGDVVGVGNSSVAYFGHQLEALPYATSYIPTTSGTESRGEDSAYKDGLSSYINDSEGVLYAEMSAIGNDLNFQNISLSDSSLLNRIYIRYPNVSNLIQVKVDVGNVNQVSITQSISDITSNTKVAFKYKANDFSLWINGTEYIGTPVNDGSVPSGLNRLGFDYGISGARFHGKVKDLRVYNTLLTDLELQELTTI